MEFPGPTNFHETYRFKGLYLGLRVMQILAHIPGRKPLYPSALSTRLTITLINPEA